MVRSPYFDSKGMKKGAWSEDEDKKLRDCVEQHGHANWKLVPNYAGLARCGKSCRLRWVNYLKPGIIRGNFSKEEQDLVIKLHSQLGNKWSAIATKLPGRTDNEIKNFWHTRIYHRKRNIQPAAKKVTGHTSDQDSSNHENNQVLEEEKTSEVTALYEEAHQNETKLSSRDTNIAPSVLAITQSQHVDPLPDIFQPDTNNSLQEQFFYYPQLYHNEYLDNFSYPCTLDWIATIDNHGIISFEYVAPPVQESFCGESSASSTSNPRSDQMGGLLIYDDPFLQFFDMDLF